MGFFANFWLWLNTQLATYIGVKVAAVALVLEPAAVTIATIYVMIWGLHASARNDPGAPR